MRKHTTTFIWFVAIAFIVSTFLLWGMQYSPSMQTQMGQPDDTVGEVNKEQVKYSDFLSVYQRLLDQRKQQNPDFEPTPQESKSLRDQAWKEITDLVLLNQEVKKLKISVTDAEIVEELKKNPPEFLKSSFMDDKGNFDYNTYLSALQEANDQIWINIEQTMKDFLPRRKLQEHIQATARLSELEIKEDYINNNEKVKIEYVSVDMNQFNNVNIQIPDDKVKAYYDANKDEYKQEEQRKVDYAMFNIAFSPEDQQELNNLKDDIYKRVMSGEDFAELAKKYSQDTGSAPRGGDLDFFGKGQMVKQFEDAAFTLKDGEVSQWIKSQFGWHLIKRHEARKQKNEKTKEMEEQVHASHILLKEEASATTKSNIADQAYQFANEAQNQPEKFEETAKKFNVQVKESPEFNQKSGFISGIGRIPEAVEFAFTSEIGKLSPVYEISGNKGYVIIKLKQIIPEKYKELETVKAQINAKLVNDRKLELAKMKADSLYQEIQSGTLMTAFAATDTSLKVQTSDLFTRKTRVKDIGRDNDVTNAAFVMPLDVVSQPLQTTKGYYLIRVIEHPQIDMEDYTRQHDAIASRLLSQKQNKVFSDWYVSVRDKADIKDYRDRFFNN